MYQCYATVKMTKEHKEMCENSQDESWINLKEYAYILLQIFSRFVPLRTTVVLLFIWPLELGIEQIMMQSVTKLGRPSHSSSEISPNQSVCGCVEGGVSLGVWKVKVKYSACIMTCSDEVGGELPAEAYGNCRQNHGEHLPNASLLLCAVIPVAF